MHVAHAALGDARAVAEIHVDAWRTAYASIVPATFLASMSVEKQEAKWAECIRRDVPELLVVKDGSGVRGWLGFGRCRDAHAPRAAAEIWALYVAPAAWSTGAGRALWLRAKER